MVVGEIPPQEQIYQEKLEFLAQQYSKPKRGNASSNPAKPAMCFARSPDGARPFTTGKGTSEP